MKNGSKLKTVTVAVIFAVLILDTSTALKGAREGITLCLSTVIPTLFPFIFVSSWLLSMVHIESGPIEKFFCKIFCCPPGSGMILISGFLGGYPVGARCIGQAVRSGHLSKERAGKMVVYCNAAGPSFLFGILGPLFSNPLIPWVLWGIHIFSAILTAWLLPKDHQSYTHHLLPSGTTLPELLKNSIKTISEVCGWIILIRILICILQKWILWRLPQELSTGIIGLLELSNGCLSVGILNNDGLKLVLCSAFLGFGGLCVALQTASVTQEVDQTLYLPGKLLQAGISFLSAYWIQRLPCWIGERIVFPVYSPAIITAILITVAYFMRKSKKSCGILDAVGV